MLYAHKYLLSLIQTQKASNIIEFEFSNYLPGDKGQTIFRELFHYQISKPHSFNGFEFNQSKYEIALHSGVKIDGNTFQIPMIDFNVDANSKNVIYKLEKLKVLDNELYIYKSGRSFHGYYLKLLTLTEWYKYLGSLLLLNDRKKPFKFVDSRWVGHSLEHGYSALRLTNNTDQYLRIPEFVAII